MEHGELAVLPAGHPEKKAHYIGLLLPPWIPDELVSTHLGLPDGGCLMERKEPFSLSSSILDAGNTLANKNDREFCSHGAYILTGKERQ